MSSEQLYDFHTEEVLSFSSIRGALEAHCSSAIAKEMARNLAMMHKKRDIMDSLMEVQEAVTSLQTEVEQPLGGTKDIREALAKTRKDIVLSRQELWDVFLTISAYKRVKKFFGEKYLQYPLLSLWVQDMPTQDMLERRFHTVFDKKGELLDSASPKLNQLRGQIHALRDRLKKTLQDILQNKEYQKFFQEAIVTQRNERYVIPVKQEYRYAFEGIIHDKSATGATLYIEPMVLVTLNNDLQEAVMEEEREIQKIFRELSQKIKQLEGSIQSALMAVSHIEFVYGKASYALTYQGVAADIREDKKVALLEARHPLLPAKHVVPTTIYLGEEYHVLLITGSNTGGKTVSLKTLGLLAMMHQSGLLIPAKEGSMLPIFSHIYADIGDEQSIEENLSTFSGHMTQVKRIMDVVTKDDLVLIDELGSGTDPEEGSALAVAIMEYFHKIGALMMVSTHYNDLKHYAYHTEGIENAHVEFNEKTLEPTYKLRIGVAGNSHALSIAKRLGLPKEVIERAYAHKEGHSHNEMESILAHLNEQLRLAEEKEVRLQKELTEARTLHKKAQKELKQVEQKKKAILEKAKEDAHNLKRTLKVETAQIIKDLKQQFSEKDEKKRQQAIQDARDSVEMLQIPEIKEKRRKIKTEQVAVGSFVYVNTLQAVGKVLSFDGKRIQVDVNGLVAKVKLTDISQATEEERGAKEEKIKIENRAMRRMMKAKETHSAVARQQAATTEINIIGQRVDEAQISVQRFIDQALLAGVSVVRIIHGKGTGALRQGVHEELKRLPVVKRFEQAGFEQGGAGATIVYL